MPTRLLFVALAGHGHITPTLPLVVELVRRGHHVDYACGPEFGDAVTTAGAQWVPLPGLPPFVPPPDVGPPTVAQWFRHFFAAMAATFPILREHGRTHRPDAIVYDATNWPARLVARELAAPAVRTVPNLAENESYAGVEQALTAGLDDDPGMLAYADDVAAFATAHRVELDVAATLDVTESLNLVFVPGRSSPRATASTPASGFWGPCSARAPASGPGNHRPRRIRSSTSPWGRSSPIIPASTGCAWMRSVTATGGSRWSSAPPIRPNSVRCRRT